MLRNFFDKLKPKSEKGQRITKLGSHVRDSIDTKRSMFIVFVALLPALFFGMWNLGYQHFISQGMTVGLWGNFFFGFWKILPLIAVSYVVGFGIEFIVARFRGEKLSEAFLVTGLLIPMLCPPSIPLWTLAVATAFAVIIGKSVFGGTGMNIWNPALLAKAFLFFSYPTVMSGDIFGPIGETSKIAILIGAIILLWTGVASFKVMFSVFVGGISVAALMHFLGIAIDPISFICMGGFMFGAVFMATDPVTSSQTSLGKWIFGFMVGAFAVIIHHLNPAHSEGMMMSILLMNTFIPLIDYLIVDSHKRRRLRRAINH